EVEELAAALRAIEPGGPLLLSGSYPRVRATPRLACETATVPAQPPRQRPPVRSPWIWAAAVAFALMIGAIGALALASSFSPDRLHTNGSCRLQIAASLAGCRWPRIFVLRRIRRRRPHAHIRPKGRRSGSGSAAETSPSSATAAVVGDQPGCKWGLEASYRPRRLTRGFVRANFGAHGCSDTVSRNGTGHSCSLHALVDGSGRVIVEPPCMATY